MSIVYKTREVDYGRGYQVVELLNGVVTDQWLRSNGNHTYTGEGNPELLGQPEKALRGSGFRKLSASAHNQMLEERAYEDRS